MANKFQPDSELTKKYMDEIMRLYRERTPPEPQVTPEKNNITEENVTSSDLPFNRDEYDIPLSNNNDDASDVSEDGDACPDGKTCGTLQVEVTTASGDIPIVNAHITVFDSDGKNVIRFMMSGIDGTSPVVTLYAPPRKYSESPEAAEEERPYSEYLVRVTARGFYPSVDINVAVFSGVKSIQSVHLLPLDEFMPVPEREMIFVQSEPEVLEGKETSE